MLKQPKACDTTCLFFNLMDDAFKCTHVTMRGLLPRRHVLFLLLQLNLFLIHVKKRETRRCPYGSQLQVFIRWPTMGSKSMFLFGIPSGFSCIHFSHESYLKLKPHSTSSPQSTRIPQTHLCIIWRFLQGTTNNVGSSHLRSV